MTTYTIADYTGSYQDALLPHPVIEAGDQYRVPEDPDSTGTTSDAREWDDFARHMRRAGLRGDYARTEGGWDYYDIVEA